MGMQPPLRQLSSQWREVENGENRGMEGWNTKGGREETVKRTHILSHTHTHRSHVHSYRQIYAQQGTGGGGEMFGAADGTMKASIAAYGPDSACMFVDARSVSFPIF